MVQEYARTNGTSDPSGAEAHRGRGAELTLDARLDLDAITRVAKHYVRWIENDGDASCLELASLANGALQHGALHVSTVEDVRALAERAAAVPRVLAAHAENLRRGARDGQGPDREVLATFVAEVFFDDPWLEVAPMLAILSVLSVARTAASPLVAFMQAQHRRRALMILRWARSRSSTNARV